MIEIFMNMKNAFYAMILFGFMSNATIIADNKINDIKNKMINTGVMVALGSMAGGIYGTGTGVICGTIHGLHKRLKGYPSHGVLNAMKKGAIKGGVVGTSLGGAAMAGLILVEEYKISTAKKDAAKKDDVEKVVNE
jgi:hypothetical protein